MSEAPGVGVSTRDSAVASTPSVDTGTAFIAGQTERGRSDVALGPFRNLEQVEATTGEEVSYGYVQKAAKRFFKRGGSRLYVGRVVGPAKVSATIALDNAGNVDTLTVTALGAGAWGNDLTIGCTLTSGTFVLTVTYDGTLVETLPATGSFADNTEAVAYVNANSEYIRLADLGQGDPKTQSLALAGGTDDRASITQTQIDAALALFNSDLGTGQVAYPGGTTTAIHTALLNHAADNNRTAILDGADTPTVATLTTEQTSLRALTNAGHGGIFGPWLVVPSSTVGINETLPPSGDILGLIAASDSRTENPNEPAAGEAGVIPDATLSQVGWSDADRATLNDAGFNVIREVYGETRVYGWRTSANPNTKPLDINLNNARLDAAIRAQSKLVGERFNFRQIDGRGQLLGEFAGALSGEVLLPLYQVGALFGDTPDDAFSVEVGEQVNTPESLATRVIKAVAMVKRSPFAERVEIEIYREELS